MALSCISCKDIVQADEQIQKSKVNFNKVLADQSNGVIMPLKTGNKWFYMVKDYDSTGTLLNSYLDSSVVYSEENTTGSSWFKVTFPMFSQNNGLGLKLSNTDAGLWVRVKDGANASLIDRVLAQYPVQASTFLIDKMKSAILTTDAYGNKTIDSVEQQVLADVEENISVTYAGKSYQAIKYKYYLKYIPSTVVGEKSFLEYTFIPNLGLYKTNEFDFTKNNLMYLKTSYELVNYVLINK